MENTAYKNLPTKSWVEERKNYIGGSEVAAILGLSPYSTPLQTWLRKKNLIPPIDSTPIMEFGNIFEPIMAEYFTNTTGLAVRNVKRTFEHPEFDYLRANIDRQILRSDAHPSTGVLELKTTTSHRMKAEEGLIPIDWYCQIQHYLGVTGYQYAYLVIYERDTCFFHTPMLIERDDKLIRQNMETLQQWWFTYMIQDKRPAPINGEDVLLIYPDSTDKVTEASAAVFEDYVRLIGVKKRIKDLETAKEDLEVSLKLHMGTADKLVAKGKTLASWKSQTTRRFDSKVFQKDYPDMYKRYINETQTRRFIVKQ